MKLSNAGVRKSDSCVLHLWSIKRFLQIIATQRLSTWLVGVFTHQPYFIPLIIKLLQKTQYYKKGIISRRGNPILPGRLAKRPGIASPADNLR